MAQPPLSRDAVLCLDIGSRTQDALFFTRGESPANAVRFVLPSPALMLARRIAAHTETRRDIYLHGVVMGGGFIQALTRHLDTGCRVAIHPETLRSFAKGAVELPEERLFLRETCPEGYSPLETGDVNLVYWKTLCLAAGLEFPPLLAVAAQDHGGGHGGAIFSCENPGYGMPLWRDTLHRFAQEGVPPEELVYTVAPPSLARLTAIQSITGGPVADSASAALLGLLCVPTIAERSHREGVLLVNAGNSRTTAFLVYRERVFGIYEQQTFGIPPAAIAKNFIDFRLGWLPNETVLAAGGRGSLFIDLPPEAEGFKAAYITGPQRNLLQNMGQMAAAFDDVTQTGCFGLLRGMAYL